MHEPQLGQLAELDAAIAATEAALVALNALRAALGKRQEGNRGPPNTWTAETWAQVTRCYRYKHQCATALGLDSKTLDLYLNAVGVDPHWRRARTPEPPRGP